MAFFAISFSSRQTQMPYLHSHDYYEFYFQLEGTRSYFCNNKHYVLNENSFVAASPNTLHKFEGVGTMKRILISASAELFSPLQIEFLNSLDNVVVAFSEDSMVQIRQTLNDLLLLYESVANDRLMQISLKLGLLFHQIHFAESKTIQSEHMLNDNFTNYAMAPTILKIMEYIQTNYNTKFSLNDICNLCSLSKTWICKCFWEANHMTIFDYKLSLQLNKAKSLLQKTDHSIERISALIGFSSPNYFSMIFKKRIGISPLRFRRQFFKK